MASVFIAVAFVVISYAPLVSLVRRIKLFFVLEGSRPVTVSIPAPVPRLTDGGDRARVAWRWAWHVARTAGRDHLSFEIIERSLLTAGYSPGFSWLLSRRAIDVFWSRIDYPDSPSQRELFV